MPAEIKKEIQLEIAHVLFTDIVGYSKLPINQQRALVERLNEIVRATDEFQAAETAGRLITIPTGDGITLVFYDSPETPAECALEISRALKKHPELQLRMGIHSGPVSGVIDATGKANVAGAGINIAQRVMDCGDAGHILLSKHVAEDLEEYPHWQPHLHELGECEVKHGVRVSVVNLHTEELGNPAVPEKLKAARVAAAAQRKKAAFRWLSVGVGSLLAVLAVIGFLLFQYRRPVELPVPEKSIAVLPFENLSRDPDNAYFATGIQDEILTRLAKIGALKVISHTSTQQYAVRPGNLREIALQLGVANILEGSVQRAADQVHINVQLIRAETGEHLWAESYDRKLERIFGVEAEVATAVAEALRAKLTSAEQQALEQKPTNNPQAYDAYLRGLAYALRPGYYERDKLAAVERFSEAAKLDPKFAVAWAWLARVSALGYFNSAGSDVAALRETAKNAVAKVTQLEPNLGEAFLAEGYFHYYCEENYDAAIASFEKARQLAPKTSDALEALALVSRRKGEWQKSFEYFRQATEIDPRNTSLLASYGETYAELREYSFALKVYDQLLEISPDNTEALASKAEIYQSTANLSEAATLLSRVRYDPSSENFFIQIWQRIYQRRFADAIALIRDAIATRDLPLGIKTTYDWTLADLKQFAGDTIGARIAWQQVRDEVESLRRQSKGERFVFPALAAAYAALGDPRKAFAIIDQVPVDALNVGGLAYLRARIAVYAGNKDSAIEQLATSAHNPVPGGSGFSATYGDLKLNPVWDSLRGDPRFEKIVASLAPKPADK
jgi:TolB-like protein/class 3 adenylate cyclase/thioredoxin-like negative regulator of GroEL